MQPPNINDLPPYVEFSKRAVEDRAQEMTNGKYGYKDVYFAAITRPGQRDTVEKEAETWLIELEKRARDNQCPAGWPGHFRAQFEAFKKGEDIPETGTPIIGWPLLSPAEAKGIIQSGIKTVEDLAAASDEALRAIGMGAATWKAKAKAFLEAATDKGALAARMATLERDFSENKGKLESILTENISLKAELAALKAKK